MSGAELDARPGWPTRLADWITARSHSRGLPIILPAFPAADFLVPIMPNQLLLAGLSALAPRRWWIFAAVFALGTALGAFMVALAIESFGIDQAMFVDPASEADEIGRLLELIREYGLPYLALISLLPWTPRLSVVACALVGLPALAIGGAVLASRIVPSSGLALIGAYGPSLLARFPLLERIIPDRFIHAGDTVGSGREDAR